MNILIIQQRNWSRKFGHEIACGIMKKIPDGRFAAIVSGMKIYEDICRTQTDIPYEFVRHCDLYDLGFDKPLTSPPISEIEADLGIPTIWELVTADRIITMNPEKKYWYDMDLQMSNQQILSLVRHIYKFIQNIEKDFSPDVIVAPNLLHLFHMMLYHYYRKRGVPYLMINDTKIRGFYTLIDTWDGSIPELEYKYKELMSSEDWTPSTKAREYLNEFRTRFIKPEYYDVSSKKKHYPLKKAMRFYRAWNLYRHLRHKQKEWSPFQHVSSIDNLSFTRHISNYFLNYRNRFFTLKLPFIKQIPEKFVLFPLHVNPELSTLVWSPHYANLLEMVRQIAMSLPGDYRLIVKEHRWMVGKRRLSYYRKLMATPNVDLVSPYADTYELIKKAHLVVTITGTTAFEMALLGKRSLIFGNLSYGILPHVHKEKDFTQLPHIFNKFLEEEGQPHTEWDKHLLAYIDSAFHVGFPLDYSSRWEGGRSVDIQILIDTYVKRIESIRKQISETNRRSG